MIVWNSKPGVRDFIASFPDGQAFPPGVAFQLKVLAMPPEGSANEVIGVDLVQFDGASSPISEFASPFVGQVVAGGIPSEGYFGVWIGGFNFAEEALGFEPAPAFGENASLLSFTSEWKIAVNFTFPG